MNFFSFFRGKTLDEHLGESKKVKISGVLFRIRKMNVVDYLHGSKVLTQNYEVWSKPENSGTPAKVAEENLKKHYRDVFLSSVVEPVLKRKEQDCGPGEVWVDRLFLDWDIANQLFMEIMCYTHGKKKVRAALRQRL